MTFIKKLSPQKHLQSTAKRVSLENDNKAEHVSSVLESRTLSLSSIRQGGRCYAEIRYSRNLFRKPIPSLLAIEIQLFLSKFFEFTSQK